MKISELVQHLEDLQDEHGDVDCVLTDADSGYSWCMKPESIKFSTGIKGTGAAIEFYETYGNAVDYLWPEPVVPESVARVHNPLSLMINKQAMGILQSMAQRNYLDEQISTASAYAPGGTISIKRPIRYNYQAGEQSTAQGRSTTEHMLSAEQDLEHQRSVDMKFFNGDPAAPSAPRGTIKATKD